jgi:hypothetical protein
MHIERILPNKKRDMLPHDERYREGLHSPGRCVGQVYAERFG